MAPPFLFTQLNCRGIPPWATLEYPKRGGRGGPYINAVAPNARTSYLEGVAMSVQIRRLVFVFLVGLFSCGTIFAQGHTIRGKVRSAAGVNVARTSVTLERNGAMVEQTVTNNEGDFTFSGLTDTSYTVIVAAVDYNPASESVEFVRSAGLDQPGEMRTVEVTLVPKEGVRPPRAGTNFVQDVPPAARAAF